MAKRKEMTLEEMKARIEEINENLTANYEEMVEQLNLVNEPTSLILWADIRITSGNSCDLLRERQLLESHIKLAEFEAKSGN